MKIKTTRTITYTCPDCLGYNYSDLGLCNTCDNGKVHITVRYPVKEQLIDTWYRVPGWLRLLLSMAFFGITVGVLSWMILWTETLWR